MRNFLPALFCGIHLFTQAQEDSLPDFSVANKGNNRVVISWNNKFKQLKQISIQRSADSNSNFKTIITVPDPNNRQNGFMDTKATTDKMFYRLYILVEGSNFIFTKSKRPVSDSILAALKADTASKAISDSAYVKLVKRIITENIPDSVLSPSELYLLRKYKDSKADLLPDSVKRKMDARMDIKTKPPLPLYHILTDQDGTVKIQLKDFDKKKYTIRFYEDDETFLFELKEIKDAMLMLDKSNFIHAGWFRSELFENGKLVEKNRFYIPKEF